MKNKTMNDFLIGIEGAVRHAPDLILLGELVFLALVILFLGQKTALGAFLLAIYPAWLVIDLAPFDFLNNAQAKIFIFFLLVLFLDYSLLRSLGPIFLGGTGLTGWLRRFLLAFLTSGLLLTLAVMWLPEKTIKTQLTALGQQLFNTPWARFGWSVAPLIFLIFFKRK